MGEILLLAVVALLVVGPDRLPSAAKAIGKGIRDLRASTKDLQSTIEQDTQIGEAVRELKGALRGDPETLYKRATGEDFHAPPKEKGESEFPKATAKVAGDGSANNTDADDTDADGASADASANEASGNEDLVPDKELGDLLDKAYANSNDGWGSVAVNPHEVEEPAVDPDLPSIKQPAGSVARVAGLDDTEGDNTDTDDSSHG